MRSKLRPSIILGAVGRYDSMFGRGTAAVGARQSVCAAGHIDYSTTIYDSLGFCRRLSSY
jgi:hypothetical protein